MNDTFLDFLSKLGGPGITAGVLWVISKRFMDETIKQMSSRIDALEKAAQACEAERRSLSDKIFQILTGGTKPVIITTTTDSTPKQ